LEYETITIADKVFTVSNGLRDYFINTFAAQNDKFVIYPCLADETKFYYSPILRSEVRKDLGIEANVTVIIYSGGVKQKWHKLDHMLTFFKEFLKNNSNSKLLLLTNDQKSLDERLVDFYDIISHVVITSVPNQEVVNYLNAADFGLLFRDNTPMNNVASPTKFAEYMLCGLPVIISEGVGDYTNFTSENNVGVVLSNDEFNDMAKINFTLLTSRVFDRHYISQIGKECFSKSVLASHLVKEFIL